MPITRHCETTFCDDVRQETSGKLSLIGVYGDALLVSEFPAQLPKLCVLAKVVSPGSDLLKSLTIRVFLGEEVFREVVIPNEELKSASENIDKNDDRNLVVSTILQFVPMQFDAPTTLKVRAITEREELWGLGLEVAKISNSGD